MFGQLDFATQLAVSGELVSSPLYASIALDEGDPAVQECPAALRRKRTRRGQRQRSERPSDELVEPA